MPKPFLYLIPLLLLALALKTLSSWLRSRKGKGQVGEWVVGSVLKGLGPGYEVLHDLTFVADGDSTQIDHVVISTRGVFLIETKNFQGRIFGKTTDSHWTLSNAQVFNIRRRLETLRATTSSKAQLHLDQLAKRHGTAISP